MRGCVVYPSSPPPDWVRTGGRERWRTSASPQRKWRSGETRRPNWSAGLPAQTSASGWKGIQIKLVPYDACMWRGDTQEGLGSYFHALPAAKGLKVCLLVVFDPTEMPYICQRQGDPTGTPLLQSYQNDVILVLTHLTLYFPFSQLLPQYFPLFTSLNLFFAVPLFSLSWCPPRAVTYCSPGNHHQ